MKKEKITRIDAKFYAELEEIRKRRLESGIDKIKIPDRKLTALIAKHKCWKQIKDEMVKLSGKTIQELLNE